MKAAIQTLSSVFLSLAILLAGHGLQQTLLPLYAQSIHWSPAEIGLTGSAYFAGFILGGYLIPQLIRRVGHIRVFTVCIGVAIAAILLAEKWQLLPVWVVARALTGLSFAGLYMVLESWLNERAPSTSRGAILSFYGFVSLVAMSVGQLLVFDASLVEGASLVAIIFAFAILPVALTTSPQPEIPSTFHSGFRSAYRASQVGPVLAGVSGFVMGLIWSNGAVYANSLLEASGPNFVLATLIGGMLCQMPAGKLSDRFDRRWVLLALCVIACTAIGAWLLLPTNPRLNLILLYGLGFVLGGTAMPMYSLAIAHANDNADGQFLAISSAMLIANGLGSAIAPLLYAGLNVLGFNNIYFISIGVVYLLAALWVVYRLTVHEPQREFYEPFQPTAKTTLVVAELDPRSEDQL